MGRKNVMEGRKTESPWTSMVVVVVVAVPVVLDETNLETEN